MEPEIAGAQCFAVVLSQIVQLSQTDSWHFVPPKELEAFVPSCRRIPS